MESCRRWRKWRYGGTTKEGIDAGCLRRSQQLSQRTTATGDGIIGMGRKKQVMHWTVSLWHGTILNSQTEYFAYSVAYTVLWQAYVPATQVAKFMSKYLGA
jgi:hypothetical protein